MSRYGYIAYGKVFQKTLKYFKKALFDGLLDGWEDRSFPVEHVVLHRHRWSKPLGGTIFAGTPHKQARKSKGVFLVVQLRTRVSTGHWSLVIGHW